jgi:HAD superfamily hydrolase (TIGR01509 family)
MPSAVLFDFGGTLDAAGLPWKQRMFRGYRDEGVAVSAERFDPAFYRVDDALVGALSDTVGLAETVRRLADGVSAGLGLDDRALTERVARRFLDDALASLHGSASLLSRLSRRYRLGIVSNFYGNLSAVCDDAGIRPFFSVVVDSARVGVTKPDPRIFRHALDALGIGPADAVFVGDSLPRDMAGARDLAMPHVWVMGAGVSASPCCPRDPVIRSLDELQGMLL